MSISVGLSADQTTSLNTSSDSVGLSTDQTATNTNTVREAAVRSILLKHPSWGPLIGEPTSTWPVAYHHSGCCGDWSDFAAVKDAGTYEKLLEKTVACNAACAPFMSSLNKDMQEATNDANRLKIMEALSAFSDVRRWIMSKGTEIFWTRFPYMNLGSFMPSPYQQKFSESANACCGNMIGEALDTAPDAETYASRYESALKCTATCTQVLNTLDAAAKDQTLTAEQQTSVKTMTDALARFRSDVGLTLDVPQTIATRQTATADAPTPVGAQTDATSTPDKDGGDAFDFAAAFENVISFDTKKFGAPEWIIVALAVALVLGVLFVVFSAAFGTGGMKGTNIANYLQSRGDFMVEARALTDSELIDAVLRR